MAERFWHIHELQQHALRAGCNASKRDITAGLSKHVTTALLPYTSKGIPMLLAFLAAAMIVVLAYTHGNRKRDKALRVLLASLFAWDVVFFLVAADVIRLVSA